MSAKSEFQATLLRASAGLKGSHLTREKRDAFCRRFARVVHASYPHVRRIRDLRMRHVRLVLANPEGVTQRTLANQLSFLRGLVGCDGNPQLIKALAVPNQQLIGPGGSRVGTGAAPTDEDFAGMLEKVQCCYLKAVLLLERAIGLRALEALCSGRSLRKWLKQLSEGHRRLEIVHGTKGGRWRETYVHDVAAAISAIGYAVEVMGNGSQLIPDRTLKQARTWYRNATHRYGIRGHGLRYAFAQQSLCYYVASGKSLEEALACVSMDLGHGSGRSRWVKSVYCRKFLASVGGSV